MIEAPALSPADHSAFLLGVRSTVAAAHSTMSPNEIAVHALQLAEELADARATALRTVRVINQMIGVVDRLQATLLMLQEAIVGLCGLFAAGRKREARERLKQMAAVPFCPTPTEELVVPTWTDEIFNPFPERRLQ